MSPSPADILGAPPSPSGSWRRTILVLAACFALLGLLGWLDFLTGYEFGFFVFYSAPVGLAAWYAGRWPAVVVALAASVTWWLADSLNGAHYSTRFYFYWNTTIHFAAFVINAVAIAKIRSELDRRHQLADELQRVRAELKQQTEQVCPVCGNRQENGTQSEPRDADQKPAFSEPSPPG